MLAIRSIINNWPHILEDFHSCIKHTWRVYDIQNSSLTNILFCHPWYLEYHIWIDSVSLDTHWQASHRLCWFSPWSVQLLFHLGKILQNGKQKNYLNLRSVDKLIMTWLTLCRKPGRGRWEEQAEDPGQWSWWHLWSHLWSILPNLFRCASISCFQVVTNWVSELPILFQLFN